MKKKVFLLFDFVLKDKNVRHLIQATKATVFILAAIQKKTSIEHVNFPFAPTI